MAKYLEKKAESLEKLNCNLASELKLQGQQTVRIQVNSWKRIVCIQVSNYPFAICKFSALFPD